MSYEGKMLQDLKMPTRKEVEQALLITLFNRHYSDNLLSGSGSRFQVV